MANIEYLGPLGKEDSKSKVEYLGPLETSISTRTEEPGFFERIFGRGPITTAERAKTQNVIAMARSLEQPLPARVPIDLVFGKTPVIPPYEPIKPTTGPSLTAVKKSYDELTKAMGIRGVPTTEELAGKMIELGILKGAATAPAHTLGALGGYMGLKEAENLLASKAQGQPYELGAGRELMELAGEVNPTTEAALKAAEFILPGVPLAPAGKAVGRYATRGIPDVLKPIPEFRTSAQVPYPEKVLTPEDVIPPGLKLPMLSAGIDFDIVKPKPKVIIRKGEPNFVAGKPTTPNVELPGAGEVNVPKVQGTPIPKFIGESNPQAEAVTEAMSKPGFLRTAEDLIALRDKGPMAEEAPLLKPKIVVTNVPEKAPIPNIPPEVEGLTYNGVQKIPGIPDQYVFTESNTGSTFYTKDISKVGLEAERDRVRDKFAKANIPSPAASTTAVPLPPTAEPPTPPAGEGSPKEIITPQTTKPQTLISWIKSRGGIWDESLPGETNQFNSKESGIVGLTSKKYGQAFDELAAQAVEDGWLPKGSSSNDLISALDKEVKAARRGEGSNRQSQTGMESSTAEYISHIEWKKDRERIAWEKREAEKKGFEYKGEGNEELVAELKPGTKLLRSGEEYVVGKEEAGTVTIKDGETIKLDVFDKIEAEAVKPPGKGGPSKLNPKEIKSLGLSDEQAKTLERIRTEDPENYRKLLKSYGETAKAKAEEVRKGKKESMGKESGLFESKPQGEFRLGSGLGGIDWKKTGEDVVSILRAMKKLNPRSVTGQSLVYVPDLRTALKDTFPTKASFDNAVMRLIEADVIAPSKHSLPLELEQKGIAKDMVEVPHDKGNYWHGLGIRPEYAGEVRNAIESAGETPKVMLKVEKNGVPIPELADRIRGTESFKEFSDIARGLSKKPVEITPEQSSRISSALEKEPSTRTFNDKIAVGTSLVNKLKDETGAIFIPGKRGRRTSPPTVLPPTPDNVKLMYEITDDALRDMHRLDMKKVKNFLVSGMVDVSGNVKRELLKNGGFAAKQVIEKKDLIAGTPAKAALILEEKQNQIYGDLSRKHIHLLDKIINSRRIVQIDQYKVKGPGNTYAQAQSYVKHPMGLSGTTHEQYLADLPRIEGITPQEYQNLNRKADQYFQTMKDQLDDLLNAGLINAKTHQKLYSLDYSPREFIQHIDPIEQVSQGGKLITIPSSGIKKLEEGSENLLNYDSRHLLSQVVSRTQARIARNNANVALHDLMLANPQNGIVSPVPKPGAPTGYGVITAMINGKPEKMMMPIELAQEWVVRDPLINSTLAKVMSWVSGAKILRATATGYNPAFAMTNIPRDLSLIWMATKEYSPVLPKAAGQQLLDIGTVWSDAIHRKGRYKDYVNEGGGMELLTHYGRAGGSGEANKISKVLGYIGETSEILNRLALRERAIKNGKSPQEATWVARNYLDFNQGGNIVKAIDTVVPYFNASVQGTRSLARVAKNDPKIFAYKAAQLMTLAGSLYMANRAINDEGYKQVSDRDKEANFIVMLPKSLGYKDDKGDFKHLYIKIAKDQGQRVFSSTMDAVMDRYFDGKIPKDQLYQAIGDFVNINPTQLIAPLQTSIFSYALNKNFWTNKDLWTGPKGIEPSEEYRVGDYPDFYLKMAKAAGISPARLAGAAGRIVPYSNPFVGLVGGGYDLISGKMSEDMKGKAAKQIFSENPSIRRLLSSTSPYVEGKAEREEIKRRGATENWTQNRTVDDLATKYLKNKDRETYTKLADFIKKQSEEDQSRLLKRVQSIKMFSDVPDHSWWVSLHNTNDPEIRAKVFMEKYSRSSADKRREMIKIAEQSSGIVSDRFIEALAKNRRQPSPGPQKSAQFMLPAAR